MKTKSPIKRWVEYLSRHFPKIYRWWISKWKDVQHCSLLEKWKSKLQWAITFHQSESTNNKSWRECGEKGTLLHCWWEYKLIQPLWRKVWKFLKKLGLKLRYNPTIPILGIYLEKTVIERDTYTPAFTEALITIARTWKQPRHLSADEWIRKLRCMYTIEYYTSIKKEYIWVSSSEVDETGAYYIVK